MDISKLSDSVVMLRNNQGVEIREDQKYCGHYKAVGAECCCGGFLIVAPLIFDPDHKRGDPFMVCDEHGIHGYRFKDLVPGRQAKI